MNLLVDVVETDDRVIIMTTPMLGLRPENVDVAVLESGRQVQIAVETVPDDPDANFRYLKRERFGRFSRQLDLPVAVRAATATARLKQDHVLEIHLWKR